jgi:hypothetical protein
VTGEFLERLDPTARLIRQCSLCDAMGSKSSEIFSNDFRIFSSGSSLTSFRPSRSAIATLREKSLKFSESSLVSTCVGSYESRLCCGVCVRTEAVSRLLLQSFNVSGELARTSEGAKRQ